MRATAYWLREAPGGSGHALVPSPHYSPGTYMRDSFWTTLALAGTPLFAATEEPIFTAFTSSVPTGGRQAGHVPVALGGALYPDESNLLYLVRLYDDAVVHHLPVENLRVAKLVLRYLQSNQVRHGAWLTTAPQRYGHFTISPDTWLDGYLYPQGAVSGYAQGLYVVALEAARRLGLGVTDAAITRADRVYQSLYDPKLGYLRWLSTTTYKGPDVLAGDALSLLLFNVPLLPAAEVTSTLAHQYWTPYGMAALATNDNTYLPARRFETLELSNLGQVIGVGETGGWYQNGGSWFLYAYLAEWAAARQGDARAGPLMGESIEDEVAVTPMSKEFQLTSTRPRYYSYPPGSSNFQRQGYGWNAAYLAFAPASSSVAGPARAGDHQAGDHQGGYTDARPGPVGPRLLRPRDRHARRGHRQGVDRVRRGHHGRPHPGHQTGPGRPGRPDRARPEWPGPAHEPLYEGELRPGHRHIDPVRCDEHRGRDQADPLGELPARRPRGHRSQNRRVRRRWPGHELFLLAVHRVPVGVEDAPAGPERLFA